MMNDPARAQFRDFLDRAISGRLERLHTVDAGLVPRPGA